MTERLSNFAANDVVLTLTRVVGQYNTGKPILEQEQIECMYVVESPTGLRATIQFNEKILRRYFPAHSFYEATWENR